MRGADGAGPLVAGIARARIVGRLALVSLPRGFGWVAQTEPKSARLRGSRRFARASEGSFQGHFDHRAKLSSRCSSGMPALVMWSAPSGRPARAPVSGGEDVKLCRFHLYPKTALVSEARPRGRVVRLRRSEE